MAWAFETWALSLGNDLARDSIVPSKSFTEKIGPLIESVGVRVFTGIQAVIEVECFMCFDSVVVMLKSRIGFFRGGIIFLNAWVGGGYLLIS